MAFKNVNVSSLKQSISSCKDAIDYSTTKYIINNLSSNVWEAESRNTLKNALNKLIDTRYKELEDYLNKCSEVIRLIEQYKEVEEKIEECDASIANYQAKIDKAHRNAYKYKVKEGDNLSKISSKTGITVSAIASYNGMSRNATIYVGQYLKIPGSSNISSWEKKIKNLKSEKKEYKEDLENLESKVSNKI